MGKNVKLRITNSSPAGRNCRVELDGVDISRLLQRVTFDAAADEVCTAVLSVLITEVEIDSQVKLWFGPGVEDLLREHGWTPPADGS
jgi:hypothetical protein